MERSNIYNNKNIVENIIKGSIADEIGLEPGDEILSINGNKIVDIIDYKYQISDEYITLEIKSIDGEIVTVEIDKEYDEDLGIEFTNPLIAKAKRCSNNCIFCFINQLPSGMRETLYFKDDDSRLSFLQGNFITLTNMSDEEIDRIIKYRISPINVSVHTTNPELREKMLCNKRAGKIFEILKKFDEAGLDINCQVVAVPGINDGFELDRTIRDLYTLKNSVSSVAIVPVGITKYRDNLPEIKPYQEETSEEIITQVTDLQNEFLEESGSRFVFLADEFYILAGAGIPEEEEYEGYPQIENGVGLVRSFYEEIVFELENIDIDKRHGDFTIVTGALAYDFMKNIAKKVMEKLINIKIDVIAIENKFFGETITVACLVTGGDIINELKNKNIDRILIPDVMLRKDTDYFLDDITLSDIKNQLGADIYVTSVDGGDFISKIFEVLDE